MNFAVRIALVGTLALLAACGGGGGGEAPPGGGVAPPPAPGPGPGPSDPPPVAGVLVTGVVAVGAPWAGAAVDTLCANGEAGATATTDAEGAYQMRMPESCTTPWLVRAQKDGSELFSMGWWPDRDPDDKFQMAPIMVTPLTDLLVDRITFERVMLRGRGSLGALRDAWSNMDPERMRAGLLQMLELLNKWRPAQLPRLSLDEILNSTFVPKPGDPMDDFLEQLKIQRGTVQAAALVEQAAKHGGSLAEGNPWKTLFGTRTSLALAGTGCQRFGNPRADVAVTLRMDGKNLSVDLAWADYDGPRTFTMGPGTRSDFMLRLKGSSEFVDASVGLSQAGHRVELFSQAGVPMVSFSYANVGATCTLASGVKRADLASFHPAARVLSVVPVAGTSGNCPAAGARAAYDYAVSGLGDVRFNGTSLAPDWLAAPHAVYTEWLQYGMGDPGPSYQLLIGPLATGQAIQPYVFRGAPAMFCTAAT
ncbi:hypothetical protein [Ramlibacter pallidus]|uniref:Carboxypeptidase regulatory-like domain-containing protein n=1 Tax=Ramlibacter pallidus TaxID=2780087 RepID=A0ABR9S254_9BURK|nr:hypothetical protein [Ramlibacter pallidus]MBE7367529.1 hypothetical protein [Ramlibacter pallidus]